MDQESDWARRCAAIVGQSVKTWRTKRRLSAQRLAERCAELGMPSLTRTVITKLENERKESVSTAELLILAQALNVPPAELMFPVGYLPAVEVAPGREMAPWDACRWLLGGALVRSAKGIEPPDTPIALWADHESLVDNNAQLTRLAATPDGQGPALAADIRDQLDSNYSVLRRIRAQMRSLGMTPPTVDAETSRELGEETPDGPR